MMKMTSFVFLTVALLALMSMQQGTAFSVLSHQRSSSTRLWAEQYVPLEGEGKINLKVRGFVIL